MVLQNSISSLSSLANHFLIHRDTEIQMLQAMAQKNDPKRVSHVADARQHSKTANPNDDGYVHTSRLSIKDSLSCS